uniref:Uncharacterized protein n=1 Tax=Meloidogyne javanica TaxID=6303 RepID=A0A915M107_MELJA
MAQSKEIKEILAKLQTFQQQINKLDDKVETLNTTDIIEKLENISTTIETAATKAVEDKERQRSLVIIGLKESTAVRPTERAKADEEERICLAQWKKKRIEMRSMEKWTKLLIRPSLTPEQLRFSSASKKYN